MDYFLEIVLVTLCWFAGLLSLFFPSPVIVVFAFIITTICFELDFWLVCLITDNDYLPISMVVDDGCVNNDWPYFRCIMLLSCGAWMTLSLIACFQLPGIFTG
jgi:hypothetical protein